MIGNQAILSKLTTALKNIGVTDLQNSILAPAQFARFVRAMQRRTNVIQEARFIEMDAQQVNIDRIGFAGRVITAGITASGPAGTDGSTKGTETKVKPTFSTNKLQAAEFRAKAGLSDRALRRNIERGNLENTLVDLFGEAAGRDTEELFLLADAEDATLDPAHLQAMTGWLHKAEHLVDDTDSSHADWPVNLFEAMLAELPKQFLVNPGEFRFYVPWKTGDKYRDYLTARKTALADSVLTEGRLPPYKGIPVVPTAMLERCTSHETAALLAHPDNLAWGIFQEVTIEPKRVAEERATEFYLTMEGDSHYEDENGAVAALIDEIS